MSGKRITMQQVRLYMSSKSQGATQAQAGAKAGVSERSARRIDRGGIGVLEAKGRDWRTRKDPFVGVWEGEVVALLARQPGLDATTLFEDLQDRQSVLGKRGARLMKANRGSLFGQVDRRRGYPRRQIPSK